MLHSSPRTTPPLLPRQVFSQMVHVGVELEFGVVLDVLEATVLELQRNHVKVANPGPKDDVDIIKVRLLVLIETKVKTGAELFELFYTEVQQQDNKWQFRIVCTFWLTIRKMPCIIFSSRPNSQWLPCEAGLVGIDARIHEP